jgi:hypothetical protein
LKQQTQAHLTLSISYTEDHGEHESSIPAAAKKRIVFCAPSAERDAAPLATETFFAFPFIEDFIDQQTPAEHKHRAMSRCASHAMLASTSDAHLQLRRHC